MLTILQLDQISDDRGWLMELFRCDKNWLPAMAYLSCTKSGMIRGPHEHRYQTDFFYFMGDFVVYLWDNRPNSTTYRKEWMFNAISTEAYLVPPGIVHGYKNISNLPGFVFNAPDKLYRGFGKNQEVDEIRHENDPEKRFSIK